MPRIYSSVSDPLDFCLQCWRRGGYGSETKAFSDYGHEGDGPDDRGNCFEWDADHPDYDDCEYDCEICKEELTSKDN